MSVSNSTNEVTKIITVNQPPQAEAGLPHIVCPGSEVVFDGTASVDRDGKLIRYEWEFGNGMTAEGATVTTVFADPGTYQVKLSVTDDSGSQCAQSESGSWVKVNALPVAVAGADRTALVGGVYDAVLFDATKSQDPDQEPLTYVWEFGDGVAEMGAKVFHRYAQPGQYKVRLRVRDSSGLHCGEAWDEVVVEAKDRK
jgi:PKD repeat protein